MNENVITIEVPKVGDLITKRPEGMDFKDFYLAGAEAYLSRYEIDCKDFIKRLDPDYGKER
jgi:hypothetical protein